MITVPDVKATAAWGRLAATTMQAARERAVVQSMYSVVLDALGTIEEFRQYTSALRGEIDVRPFNYRVQSAPASNTYCEYLAVAGKFELYSKLLNGAIDLHVMLADGRGTRVLTNDDVDADADTSILEACVGAPITAKRFVLLALLLVAFSGNEDFVLECTTRISWLSEALYPHIELLTFLQDVDRWEPCTAPRSTHEPLRQMQYAAYLANRPMGVYERLQREFTKEVKRG